MVGIFDPLNPQSDQHRSGKVLAPTAGNGLVDWAEFIATEPHGIPPDGTGEVTWVGRNSRAERSLCRGAATIPVREESMANLANVVQQLRKEMDQAQRKVEQLDEALKALGGLGGVRAGVGRLARAQMPGKRRRTMSAAARKRIAAAQRARWAKWKAARRAK
jgi:hypothetical protein